MMRFSLNQINVQKEMWGTDIPSKVCHEEYVITLTPCFGASALVQLALFFCASNGVISCYARDVQKKGAG
jgi:hypothetical protein